MGHSLGHLGPVCVCVCVCVCEGGKGGRGTICMTFILECTFCIQQHVMYIITHSNNKNSCTKRHYMCQSRVEIEHYSVAYFDCVTEFEVL